MDLKDLKVPTILVQQLCLNKIKIDEGTQVLPDTPKKEEKTNKLFSDLLLEVKKTKQKNPTTCPIYTLCMMCSKTKEGFMACSSETLLLCNSLLFQMVSDMKSNLLCLT